MNILIGLLLCVSAIMASAGATLLFLPPGCEARIGLQQEAGHHHQWNDHGTDHSGRESYQQLSEGESRTRNALGWNLTGI